MTTRVLPMRAPGAVSRRSFLRTSPTISTRSPSCVLTMSMSFRGPFRRKLRPVTFGPRRMKSSRGCVAVNTRPLRQPVVAISTESSGIFFASGSGGAGPAAPEPGGNRQQDGDEQARARVDMSGSMAGRPLARRPCPIYHSQTRRPAAPAGPDAGLARLRRSCSRIAALRSAPQR